MKIFMRSFWVAFVVALTLVVGAGSASAAKSTTTVIQWFSGAGAGCRNGSATVPAGAVKVTFGWGTYSASYTNQFLGIQYVTYSVNGVQTVTAAGDKTGWNNTVGKDLAGAKTYVAWWTSPTLATLAQGESVTVTMSLKTTDTVYDNETTPYAAGTELLGTYTTCTITAA